MDQFSESFASHWDDLVGWEQRSRIDIPFLVSILKNYNCKDLLDVAVGTGFHSINLLKKGFNLTASDISKSMLEVAKNNSKIHNVKLNLICSDWSHLFSANLKKFDCIFCLGNSLACENNYEKRESAILNWSKLLKDDGIIIVDRRNYEQILKNRQFSNSKKLYCGNNVNIKAEILNSENTVFSYEFLDGKKFFLQMYPLLDSHIKSLFAKQNLFPVELFGDYKLDFDMNNTNFYHYVFSKQKI